jgi:hypothetical protein
MPRLFGVAALWTAAVVAGGCVAQREPLAVIQPEFSYLLDGEGSPVEAVGLPAVMQTPLADATDEEALISAPLPRHVTRLVRTSAE